MKVSGFGECAGTGAAVAAVVSGSPMGLVRARAALAAHQLSRAAAQGLPMPAVLEHTHGWAVTKLSPDRPGMVDWDAGRLSWQAQPPGWPR